MSCYKHPQVKMLWLKVERGFENTEQDDDMNYENSGTAWDNY